MKIKKTVLLAFCLALITVSNVLAFQPGPPTVPIKPPGAPIDQNLFILAGFALLLGVYVIRRYYLTKKASI